jgi:Tfp pilus assembly protein PilN
MRSPFARQPIDAGASFLPEDYVERRAELRANLLCLGLFGIAMFAVVGAFFFTNRQWLSVRTEQQAINVLYTQEAKRIEQLKVLEQQKADMLSKAEITAALIERVPRSVLLAEIVTRMPDDITLLEIRLESKRVVPVAATKPDAATSKTQQRVRTLSGSVRGRTTEKPGDAGKGADAAQKVAPPKFEQTLTLVGVGRENTNVADYVAALKACALVRDVELKFIRETTIDKINLRRFEITAKLRDDADARKIEAPADLRLTSPDTIVGRERRGEAHGSAARPAEER